jgi:hypothetical protein
VRSLPHQILCKNGHRDRFIDVFDRWIGARAMADWNSGETVCLCMYSPGEKWLVES